MTTKRTLREALADLCGLRDRISDDVEAFDIGKNPETGEWRVWHGDYPEEGSMALRATVNETMREERDQARVEVHNAYALQDDLRRITKALERDLSDSRMMLAAAVAATDAARRERDEARAAIDYAMSERHATEARSRAAEKDAAIWKASAQAAVREADVLRALAEGIASRPPPAPDEECELCRGELQELARTALAELDGRTAAGRERTEGEATAGDRVRDALRVLARWDRLDALSAHDAHQMRESFRIALTGSASPGDDGAGAPSGSFYADDGQGFQYPPETKEDTKP